MAKRDIEMRIFYLHSQSIYIIDKMKDLKTTNVSMLLLLLAWRSSSPCLICIPFATVASRPQ